MDIFLVEIYQNVQVYMFCSCHKQRQKHFILIRKILGIGRISKQCAEINDSICEKYFVENTTRNNGGRFIVSLPRKSDEVELGNSYINAETRFLNLVQKFECDRSFKLNYSNFIREY